MLLWELKFVRKLLDFTLTMKNSDLPIINFDKKWKQIVFSTVQHLAIDLWVWSEGLYILTESYVPTLYVLWERAIGALSFNLLNIWVSGWSCCQTYSNFINHYSHKWYNQPISILVILNRTALPCINRRRCYK